ncbi:MAG: response regulator [Ignavibacteria bacterium]|nr:response regulator [Ignavibacteria bacterium]MDP3830691.1 response regulator [Ignavibacteriaceae bacterium]
MDKKRILLVEDDQLNSGVIKVFLSSVFEVDHADNGQTAIDLSEQFNYSAFLMDINLGRGLNGLEVAQHLKNQNKYKNTPIIAITAYAMESDKREFLQKGCTHYLSKPFFKKDILALINRALDEAEVI